MTRTRTYSVLAVPAAVYGAIRALLNAADYTHAFHPDTTHGEVIDMTGIALARRMDSAIHSGTSITISTLVSRSDGQGKIDFQLNGELTQMDLTKAREIHRILGEAIEAATSDQLIVQFLTQKMGVEKEKAIYALVDFREMRQGSRGTVYPS